VVAQEDDHLAQIHCESHADMFFAYLEKVGSAVVQRVAAQLMHYGDRELVT
jgi:hypothetical protein